mgnify:CR=1 FL=1
MRNRQNSRHRVNVFLRKRHTGGRFWTPKMVTCIAFATQKSSLGLTVFDDSQERHEFGNIAFLEFVQKVLGFPGCAERENAWIPNGFEWFPENDTFWKEAFSGGSRVQWLCSQPYSNKSGKLAERPNLASQFLICVCLAQIRIINSNSLGKWTSNIPELADLAAQFFHMRLFSVLSLICYCTACRVGNWRTRVATSTASPRSRPERRPPPLIVKAPPVSEAAGFGRWHNFHIL